MYTVLHVVIFVVIILVLFGSSQQALAVLTPVTHFDEPNCDTLVVPPTVDELGIAPPFPPGEVIAISDFPGKRIPCPSTDEGIIPNSIVDIVNLNAFPFTKVWYVTDDPETTITNFDGVVMGPGGIGRAFLIDTAGINTPLFSESMTADGIFEPGETWRFVIQDYFNTFGLPPSAIDSIGVSSVPTPPTPPGRSSGSIIAVQGISPPPPSPVGGELIPVDSTMVLVAGTQNIAAWMIPVIVSAIGIGIVIARKF